MNLDPRPANAFTIIDAPKLDPITVILQDLAPGKGRIIIECFGMAWSAYWNAMGGKSVGDFVARCDSEYIVDNLLRINRTTARREKMYLLRIVAAVREALRSQNTTA